MHLRLEWTCGIQAQKMSSQRRMRPKLIWGSSWSWIIISPRSVWNGWYVVIREWTHMWTTLVLDGPVWLIIYIYIYRGHIWEPSSLVSLLLSILPRSPCATNKYACTSTFLLFIHSSSSFPLSSLLVLPPLHSSPLPLQCTMYWYTCTDLYGPDEYESSS